MFIAPQGEGMGLEKGIPVSRGGGCGAAGGA